MLIMTESIFLQQPAQQKLFFNQALHNSMIWILDKIIQAMRAQTIPQSSQYYAGAAFAPTFEICDLGPRDQAFGKLVEMANHVNTLCGQEPWYTDDIQYYVNLIPGLPDVSSMWPKWVPTPPPALPVPSPGFCFPKYFLVQYFSPAPPADNVLVPGEVRHACMGLNSCAGQGRTRVNACAGQGYCSTALAYDYSKPGTPKVSDHTCHVKNACKGQGGCGLYGTADEQANPGANDCATLGSCATPINAERFATEGPAAGQSVWLRARAVFAAKVWPGLKHANPRLPARPPQVPGSESDPNLFQNGPTIEWIQSYSGQGMTACGSSGMSGAGSCS
ncbi:MAG: hypothetical protein ACKO9A_20570 [Alphaproteobacteria bacterium]